MNLEHPDIGRLGSFGATETETTGYCYYCDNDIYDYETHYNLDSFMVCDDFDCRMKAFEANADEMLKLFAEDMDITVEAVEWYLKTFSGGEFHY